LYSCSPNAILISPHIFQNPRNLWLYEIIVPKTNKSTTNPNGGVIFLLP